MREGGPGRQRLARGLRLAAGAACVVCVCALGSLSAQAGLAADAYRDLAPRVGSGPASAGPARSWQDDLPRAIAWLEVEGTPISYPVMRPDEGEAAHFYLDHDAWGSPSPWGCPYLDTRCEPQAAHRLVYGHSTGFDSLMFEPLRRAYTAAVFNGIGSARWTDRTGASVAYEPLCALRVPAGFAPIQQFSLSEDEAGPFALALAGEASVRAEGWREQAIRAGRVLTLATCAGAQTGTDERTLVIFTATDA